MKKIILLSACAISFGAFAQVPTPNASTSTQDKLSSAKAKATDAKTNAVDAKNSVKSDPVGSLNKANTSKEKAGGAVSDVKSMVPGK